MTWVMEIRQKMSMYTHVILQPECFKSRLCSSMSLLRVFISCSSRCRKVIPVNVSIFSYHSFLDCYTVPKMGVLIFQGIVQHCHRQRKGMQVQNKSQLPSDNDMKITESVRPFYLK